MYYHLYCEFRCFWRNLHHWQKFCTAAGSDGIDKSHLWSPEIVFWSILTKTKRDQALPSHVHGIFCLQQYSVGNFFLGHPVLISAQGLAAALNCPTSPPHNMVFVTAGFFHHYAHLNHLYYRNFKHHHHHYHEHS